MSNITVHEQHATGTEAERILEVCLDNPGMTVRVTKNSKTPAQRLRRLVEALGAESRTTRVDDGYCVESWVNHPEPQDFTQIGEGWAVENCDESAPVELDPPEVDESAYHDPAWRDH